MMSWRPLVVVALVVLGAIAFGSADAGASAASKWYWSPGYCKSQLKNRGVQFGDGRTFYAAQSFCIGVGGSTTCEWWHGERQYAKFTALARANDGVVRMFNLRTTGRTTWTAPGARILEQRMSADDFIREYGSAAWTLAQREQKKGCAGSP